MPQRQLDSLTHAQRERLAFIDFRLCFMGEVGRRDVIARFGIAPAAATRDFALYRELAPNNTELDGSNKIYRISEGFTSLFEHKPQQVLALLSTGIEDSVQASSAPLLPCESPSILSSPSIEVLAPICRAIHAKRPLAISYHSMSSGETQREIAPFALVNSGLRWHVRAFDRKHGEFRDFVLTRITAARILPELARDYELAERDQQWQRIVELTLIPHPRLARPEIVAMDYGMVGGVLRVSVRAAMAGYLLLHWHVDCSPDHRLQEEQYRLWLSDPLALDGIENSTLAPGYHLPIGRTDS